MLTRPITFCRELDPRCHQASHVLAFLVELLNPPSSTRDFVVTSCVALYTSPSRIVVEPIEPRSSLLNLVEP
jgi:hypothetical protein